MAQKYGEGRYQRYSHDDKPYQFIWPFKLQSTQTPFYLSIFNPVGVKKPRPRELNITGFRGNESVDWHILADEPAWISLSKKSLPNHKAPLELNLSELSQQQESTLSTVLKSLFNVRL